MVSVKRAQTHHFTSLLLQTHMLANDLNDIVGLLNLQDNRIIKHPCHKTQVPSDENAKIKDQVSKLRNPPPADDFFNTTFCILHFDSL
jgi:hypothetical protein